MRRNLGWCEVRANAKIRLGRGTTTIGIRNVIIVGNVNDITFNTAETAEQCVVEQHGSVLADKVCTVLVATDSIFRPSLADTSSRTTS